MSSRFDLRESDTVFNEFQQFKQACGIVEPESDKSKESNLENQGGQTTSGAETPKAGGETGGGGGRRCLFQHKLPPLITSVPVMEIRRTCDAIIAKNESRGYHNVSFLRVDQRELKNVKPTLNGINTSKSDVKSNNQNESGHDVSNKREGERVNFFTGEPIANSSNQSGMPMEHKGYCSQNLKRYCLHGDHANPYGGQHSTYGETSVDSSSVNPCNQVPNYPHCSNTEMNVLNSTSLLPVPCSTCQSAALGVNDNMLARPQDILQSQCKESAQPMKGDCCCRSRYTCFNKMVDDRCQCRRNQVGHCSAYHGNNQASEEDCCCNKRNSCRTHFKCENKGNMDMHEDCCCGQGEHQNVRNWRSDSGCWAFPCHSSQCCSRKNSSSYDCDSHSLGPSSSNSLCLAPYDPRIANNKEMAQSLPNLNTFVNEYPIEDLLEALRMNQMALSIGVRPPLDDLSDDYKCCCEKESRLCDNLSERAVWIPEDEPATRFSRSSLRSHLGRRMANYDMSSDDNEMYPSETKIFPFPSQTSRMTSRRKSRRPVQKIVVDWGDKNQYNFCHDMDREGLTDNHCNCGISNRIRAKRKSGSRCSMKNFENYR